MEREGGDRVAAREEGVKVGGAPLAVRLTRAASDARRQISASRDLTVPAVATAELLVATS